MSFWTKSLLIIIKMLLLIQYPDTGIQGAQFTLQRTINEAVVTISILLTVLKHLMDFHQLAGLTFARMFVPQYMSFNSYIKQ